MWVTGQVIDDLGRALPGVTVEASGPPGLSPRAVGAYTLTFVRPGFSTLRRTTDEISTFVTTINARLQASSLQAASD